MHNMFERGRIFCFLNKHLFLSFNTLAQLQYNTLNITPIQNNYKNKDLSTAEQFISL